jgi:nucleoside 2-deoxyribosyltransferase
MKIYFACAITGGREYEQNYQALTRFLLDSGYEVPTAYFAEADILDNEQSHSPSTVYARDLNWIQTSDLLIAEISVPSHGVGYEIGYALAAEKPVLCLYQAGRRVSKMITGNPHPRLRIRAYQEISEAFREIEEFVKIVTKSS